MSDERRPSLIERAKEVIAHVAEIGARSITDDHDRQTRLESVIYENDKSQSVDDNFRTGLAPGEKLDPAGERWESSTVPSSVLEGNRAPAVQHHHGILDRDADVPAMAERMSADNTPHYGRDRESPPDNAPMGGWASPLGHPTVTAASSTSTTKSTTSHISDAINAALHTTGITAAPAPTDTVSDRSHFDTAPLNPVSTHTSPDNTSHLGSLGFVTDHMNPTSRDKMGAWAYHQGESQTHLHGGAMPVSSDYGSMAGYSSGSSADTSHGGGIVDSVKHGVSSLVSGVANLAHKAENTVETGIDHARQTTSSAVGSVEHGVERVYDSAKSSVHAGVDDVKHMVSSAVDTTRSAAHNVESRADKLLDTATDKVYDAYGAVKGKTGEVLGEAKAETHTVAEKAREVIAKAADVVTGGLKADHDKQLGQGDSAVVGIAGKATDPHEDHVDIMLT